jgi:hypothetical protein
MINTYCNQIQTLYKHFNDFLFIEDLNNQNIYTLILKSQTQI